MSYLLHHICGNVNMVVIYYRIKKGEFFSKNRKYEKKVIFRQFIFHPSSAPEEFLRMFLGFLMSRGV